ncbi:MAG: sulfite exporter TauE/SafE family protein [bacterium]|nr:sulfite exporter TauE/SafE family protein [bacterium]
MFIWIIATICAFFIKGLCGFANTLVFTSILSFGITNINISPVELILGYPTNMIVAWKERKSIKWSVCIPLSILVIAGCIPGILFLKNTDTHIIKILFGFIIILIGCEMLQREFKEKKQKQSKLLLLSIGILSGVLCGLYGIGALLGAYLGRVTEESGAFKANICIVFLVENTVRIVLYSIYGIITVSALKSAALLAPCMLLGLFLGIKSSKRLDEKLVKKLVVVMLIISGVALLINNL